MDYLTTHLRGSAPSLLVISRHLAAAGPQGRTPEQLQAELQPEHMMKRVAVASSLLGPALRIGEDLGLFEQDKTGGELVWRLRAVVDKPVPASAYRNERTFYARVFAALNARALTDIDSDDPSKLSDVALGMIWFSQRNPLLPLSTVWDGATENEVKSAGIRSDAIYNEERWRVFRRWAVNLGVATLAERSVRNSYITADCTRAVGSVLGAMPRQASADTWMGQLLSKLPLLGHPRLLRVLPIPPPEPDVIGGSLAFALLKLERRKKVEFVRSADAANTMVLKVGNTITRIGEIRVLEASTA